MRTIPDTQNALLVLPLTPALLQDPGPLLPTVYQAAHHATSTLTVVFSTPSGPQLYPALRAAPRVHWDAFQHFLGKVYAALAAGHWGAGHILVDVEVRFDGEPGDWKHKLLAKPDVVAFLDGYADLAPAIIEAAAAGVTQHLVPTPKLPSAAGDLSETAPAPGYPETAIGGTFDHLHAAHKLLINTQLFVTEKRMFVGVISDSLLASKSNAKLVDKLDRRIADVKAFLQRCGPGDVFPDVAEIHDGLGPTAWDPSFTGLVVSRETMTGGKEVNRVRSEKGLGALDILSVDVISSTVASDGDDVLHTVDLGEVDDAQLKNLKMGSTAIREWMAAHPQQTTRP